jgi:hypothetical protein
MHTRPVLSLILASLFLSAGAIARDDKPKATEDLPPLALVVVENTGRDQVGAITDFHRLDLAFEYVAKQRKWPVRIEAERFAANTAKHETELRVYLKPLVDETPVDLMFRCWVTLTMNGKTHDFRVISYRHNRRIGENTEDTLEKVFRGAAKAIAEKVEPVLFPKASDAKP